jgi:hypothetical protein
MLRCEFPITPGGLHEIWFESHGMITIQIPLRLSKRGGRKLVIAPDGRPAWRGWNFSSARGYRSQKTLSPMNSIYGRCGLMLWPKVMPFACISQNFNERRARCAHSDRLSCAR